jgi:CheY-like chemotaxis protein
MCMEHLHLDSRENLPVGSVKDDIIHTIELCQANCSFMTAAINRTVDFAKSASNFALQPKMESTSILTSMKWTATCMASTQSRIPIVISPIPADICKYVVTDKHWFMENILCYLSNAVKYSSGGVITVSAHLQDSNVTKSKSSNDKKKPTKQNALSKALSSLLMPSVELVDMSSQASVSDAGACRMLCISVEDEGIGIEGDKGASLFKPFQQTMRMAGGTGLGLYSLAKRVEVLNGSYGVSNRIDGRPGSRFWFTIPYNPDEVYTQQFMDEVSVSESLSNMRNTIGKVGEKEGYSYNEKASQRSALASCERKILPVENDVQDRSSRILHALVVEDSLVITKATVRMLKKAGYVVDVAENGAVGLDKMKKIFYSIVIMDLQMPIMDGLEATRRMRSWEDQNSASLIELGRQKQLIVGVSANGADDVMKDALANGMDSFLPKPFSVNNLMDFQISSVDSP